MTAGRGSFNARNASLMTRDDIMSKVTEVLVDALGIDPEEVVEDAKLTSDLGAESIDFLDITFKLEQAFAKFLEGMGVYYELGYSWSAHIYPIDRL